MTIKLTVDAMNLMACFPKETESSSKFHYHSYALSLMKIAKMQLFVLLLVQIKLINKTISHNK